MAIFKSCKQCGKTILVQPHRFKRSKFCSKECMDDWWTGKRRSPETEFHKGNIPQTWVPVGTESDATKGGYIKIKIAEPNKWKLRSHITWEKSHNKQLPEGWIVRHLDGDPKNDDISNLKAMPRSKHILKTLEDPEINARARKSVSKATKKRWHNYRMKQFDSYYWQTNQ